MFTSIKLALFGFGSGLVVYAIHTQEQEDVIRQIINAFDALMYFGIG